MVRFSPAAMFFAFVAIMGAAAFRTEEDKTQEADAGRMTKCIAQGISGGAVGMFITWGSTRAIQECGPSRSNSGEGFTYEYKFTEAFTVTFTHKCDCQINGETIVSFKPLTLHQARICAGTEQTEDKMELNRHCWDAYMRGRGTGFRQLGDISIPEYKLPWLSGNFRVSREGPCDGVDCNSIALPGVLDGMSRDHKRLIGDGIKKIMDGKKDEVPEGLRQMIDILPDDALDDAEFAVIDEDGDGTLSLDELANFYPQFDRPVIEQFIKDVDANGNGTVDPEEFSNLKQKMRDYDPKVDLIDGEVDFLLMDDGGLHKEVVDAKPEWKVKTVICMKEGKEVDAQECRDHEEETDAIREFNTNCESRP